MKPCKYLGVELVFDSPPELQLFCDNVEGMLKTTYIKPGHRYHNEIYDRIKIGNQLVCEICPNYEAVE